MHGSGTGPDLANLGGVPSRTAPPGHRVALALVWGAVLVALLLVAGLMSAMLARDDSRERPEPGDGLVAADVERDTPVTQPSPLAKGTDLTAWAATVAKRVKVPARALRAYGAAELAQRAKRPKCRMSWAMLAGIARVESDHGRLGVSDLDADGVARPRIIGVPLDGTHDTRLVRDTDDGKLDGDENFDRAVGPLQFLPSTWKRYGADGNGDGVRDPHQLDDAAMAAAAYLCAAGRDTATGAGWWDGVLTYNQSLEYGRLVWAAADRYATAAAA
jgi:membrane-bound lytic murein transglycosylase B